MEIRILFCLLGLFGSGLSLEVSYNGPELFPMNEEATLLCQISPTPNTPEGANNLAVWWSQVNLTTGTRTKLGKSSVDESYLYSTIPNGLNDRFTTSTDEFIYGTAKASIANVGIADDKTYQCEVEDLTSHDATDTQFKLNVYLEPDVQIYDEETNLDIRPIKQTEPTETATENPIYDDAIPDTPAPAAVNVNVSIAQCVATNAFPKPTKFEFVSDSTGNTWTVVNENEIMYVENADGTFNASAVLRIDPSAELDGAEISCRTWLYPSLSYASAGTTSPIVVKHMTNEATISLSTTEAVEGDRVSISCTANGNPPPTIELQDPAGNIHNVTGVNYVISRAQVEHAGVYVCHAYNDADATLATAEGTLSVEWVGNPRVKNNGNRIVNKLVEVTLGDSINIVCAAQGYPAPQITVVRGTQPLQGSTVTRNSVTYADAGSYSCKAATGNIVKITNFQVVVNGGCVVSLQKVV
uniref:Ig-like domain-containing protein n=1 Tax=Ciona savignyi TaxID=51511 RepID=H2YDH9_CIOSA